MYLQWNCTQVLNNGNIFPYFLPEEEGKEDKEREEEEDLYNLRRLNPSTLGWGLLLKQSLCRKIGFLAEGLQGRKMDSESMRQIKCQPRPSPQILSYHGNVSTVSG